MRVVLTILCLLIIVFVGGCLVTAPYMQASFSLLLWCILLLNVAVIAGTWTNVWYLRPALFLLAAVDVAIAVGSLYQIELSFGGPSADFWMLPAAAGAFFAIKAALTFRYARQRHG